MLISIVIPVYNAERFIYKCIDSVLIAKKSYNIELILINDGSTDKSLEICNKYAAKYNVIKTISQVNAGPSIARNKGIDIAEGDYITFIDADDYVDENYFDIIIENVQKYNNTDVIIFGYYKVTQRSKKLNYSYFEFDKIFEHSDVLRIMKNTFDYDYLLFPVNKIYKKKLFNSGIRFDRELRLGEDAIFNLEIFYEAKSIIFVKQSLYNYYENLDSVTSQKYKPNLYNAMESHFKRKIAFYESKKELNKTIYFEDIARVNLEKTFYRFISNILANRQLNFKEELKKIRSLDLIRFGYKYIQLSQVKRLKNKVTLLLFKYNQFKILELIYKK